MILTKKNLCTTKEKHVAHMFQSLIFKNEIWLLFPQYIVVWCKVLCTFLRLFFMQKFSYLHVEKAYPYFGKYCAFLKPWKAQSEFTKKNVHKKSSLPYRSLDFLLCALFLNQGTKTVYNILIAKPKRISKMYLWI